MQCTSKSEKFRTKEKKIKECVSGFTLISYNERTNTSLVRCKPYTGRTHQLRIHLYSLGHPIVNEPIYTAELLERRGVKKNFPSAEQHSGASEPLVCVRTEAIASKQNEDNADSEEWHCVPTAPDCDPNCYECNHPNHNESKEQRCV